MEEEGRKKEDSFKFTSSGETLGYIELDEARVLAIRHAREMPTSLVRLLDRNIQA